MKAPIKIKNAVTGKKYSLTPKTVAPAQPLRQGSKFAAQVGKPKLA